MIPNYLFGVLTIGFAPVWDDVVHALSKVAEVNEEVVANLAFEWLLRNSTVDEEPRESDSKSVAPLTMVECSNLRAIEEMSNKSMNSCASSLTELHSDFEKVCTHLGNYALAPEF